VLSAVCAIHRVQHIAKRSGDILARSLLKNGDEVVVKKGKGLRVLSKTERVNIIGQIVKLVVVYCPGPETIR
jgi:hypothetical protein